jgi:hypothetical protein
LSMVMRPLFRLIYRYKDYRDKKRNRGTHADLYATVLSDAVFFGECLIILAKKAA